jgi:hypothetical protein
MAYLLEKRRSALPIPREKGRMTMATDSAAALIPSDTKILL